jgi:hypothetical protein
VTLKFALRADSRGFRTSAGTIRDVAIALSGAAVVYVRVTLPASSVLPVTVDPDPSGKGAQPGSVSTGPVLTAGGSRSGGGGGGCRAGGEGGAGGLGWLAAFLAGLAAWRVGGRGGRRA